MDDDWDLHAVVRGCAAATATSSAAATKIKSYQPLNISQQDYSFSRCCLEDLLEPRRSSFVQEELHDLYKPFFPNSVHASEILFSLPISPLSVLGVSRDPPPPPQITKQLPQQTQLRQKKQPFSVSTGSKTSLSHTPNPRSKRRKSHTKKVCHVSAENLSSDVWSWRKYGQKPIKGSPYPRGYYRCSTSKGCMARKQVERNKSDPGMFIVTYTAEHNHPMPTHRNSLAGSTRQKMPETVVTSIDRKSSSSPELSPASSLSPVPEKFDSSREDLAEAEDDDGFSVSKMELDDDFFAGLEDFTAVECTSGHFPASLQFPWLSASATTTAGGG